MVDTDDLPLSGKGQDRKDACVGGMERLADQAARQTLDEWLASPRTVQVDGDGAVISFTAVQGKITAVRVDDVWYVADPGIGPFVFG